MVAIDLFMSFARIGTLAWGGGPAMVPLMQAEVVEQHGWMSNEQFVDSLAAGYALPGPIATKMAVIIGYQAGGLGGAAASFLGMVLPSTVLVFLLLGSLLAFKDDPRVRGMLAWVRPVVVALLVFMVVDIAPRSITGWKGLLVGTVALLLLYLKVPPAGLILVAALSGAVFHAQE